jgi:VanZ family protein
MARLRLFWPLPEAVVVAWGACVIYVAWQSLLPNPDVPFSFENADKLLHLFGYFGLALLPYAGFREERQARAAALCMIALGALLEFGQGFIPERTTSLADMTANACGVFLGIWAGRTLRRAVIFPPDDARY